MDKLQPVLAHKFWILFGLAIILPAAGWWRGLGAIEVDIDTRTAAVEQAFNKVPTENDIPNQEWIASAKEINAEERQRLNQSAAYLWQTQQNLMTWPKEVSSMEHDVKIDELEYRADLPSFPHCEFYRKAYHQQFQELRKIVDPYEPATEEGKVAIGWNFFLQQVPMGKWGDQFPPPSPEVWSAQEDVWLVRSILKAIAEVNRHADNISEATVKQIDWIGLYGGGAPTADEPAASSGAGGAASPVAGFGGGMMLGGEDEDETPRRKAGDNRDGGGKTLRGGKGANAPFEFNPSKEFGTGEGRYVDATPLYRTRGFVVQVVMDHRELPELVSQLTAMPFPAFVVRINQRPTQASGGPPSGNSGSPGGPLSQSGALGNSFRGLGAGGIFGGGGTATNQPTSARNGRRGEDFMTLYDAVIADPYLADIAVAGVMTLYRPPASAAVAQASDSKPPGGAQPAAGGPADTTDQVLPATAEAAAGVEQNAAESAASEGLPESGAESERGTAASTEDEAGAAPESAPSDSSSGPDEEKNPGDSSQPAQSPREGEQ